jgi:hypothetical protein
MLELAGRMCPLRYRYGARALSLVPFQTAQTLYVVGGLYGNSEALDTIEHMASQEPGPVTVCFNGDFNWFNADDASFQQVNERVLQHTATLGNVEAELGAQSDAAGCGCAYPDEVDNGTVERSNRIHARLKQVADRFPGLQQKLQALPMFARFVVGDCRVAVVHGDADSLAGWAFDAGRLEAAGSWLVTAFAQAQVDVFASSHTCQPALWSGEGVSAGQYVINNGAAGMPNFRGERAGLITRIGTLASPHGSLYGVRRKGVWIDALAVPYDSAAWEQRFQDLWPEGSDAYVSYFQRILANTGDATHPLRGRVSSKSC